nr:cache domain-containing protein [Motiliproteus sediminis]
MILLAIIPLLLVVALITLISLNQARDLGEHEIATFERNLISSKQQELRHYVELALTAIDHVYSAPGLPSDAAKAQVKAILQNLTYGDDGYFFVYDAEGVNLVHPIQPELVGRNLIDLADPNGDLIIQNLLRLASDGGGYHRYQWNKPSLGELEDKLSYVVQLPKWGWMLGTGLYLDDIGREVAKIRDQVSDNIRNTFLTVLAITSITVVVIVVIAIAFNLHEHRLADTRLRELASRSLQFQLSERRRFSRELHDGINQLMVSIKFRLELAQQRLHDHPDKAAEDLSKGQKVLNETIQEVRRISHDMRPTVLDDLGFEAGLNSLLEEFSLRTGIQVDLDVELQGRPLSEEVDITLYRVVQEALTNIERHADASRLSLRAYWRKAYFHLELTDNGCGFDDPRATDGIGISNMRERVELLGGRFVIDSQRGNGTYIQAELPMELYG